jgi:hypothetical protein
MALRIPVRTDLDHHTVDVDLEGVTYNLELIYNTRAGAWFLSVNTDAGEPITTSIRLVSGFPLLGGLRDLRRPRGDFVIVDNENKGADPTRASLGQRHQLIYLLSSELT